MSGWAIFIIAGIGAAFGNLLMSLASNDVSACLPRLQRWLIRIAVARLPEHKRSGAAEQYQADIEAMWESQLMRTLYAADCIRGARAIQISYDRDCESAQKVRAKAESARNKLIARISAQETKHAELEWRLAVLMRTMSSDQKMVAVHRSLLLQHLIKALRNVDESGRSVEEGNYLLDRIEEAERTFFKGLPRKAK